ncbi:Glutamine synthetase, beta-Grasp [Coniochaeta hoffmannii]|uniref:Glutamine synthetase, beta-Grasp n=1 Tax=Coniochaeta hoffmannii TaxID=91930 RepID=A0AA38R3N7_9PEZI|nr:Glutamine synthetase, beta-Grasp [Coniochaeta hoffmannii]
MSEEFFNEHAGVKYVRVQWTDYSGIFHCRLITKAKCLRMIQADHPYKAPVNSVITPISTAPGCDASPPQVWELHPEWDTLRLCGFAPAHASVICSFTRTGAENPFAMCPRTLLQRTVKEFEDQYSASLLVGFEVEFVLLDESLQVPASLDRIEGSSMSSGIRGRSLAIVEDIFDALEMSDVPVHHMHTEAKDQLEFSMEPRSPMRAVDDLMYAQETIRTVAIRHGLKATMTPKPFLKRFPTNGLHMHISVSPTSLGDSFLAGILSKLRVLCAFGLPSWDSYHRVEDDGTGVWVGWGTENRDLPLRGIGPAHWEIRPADTTANFYLFLAVAVAAGSAGIEVERPLTWKDCRIFPENLSLSERAHYGIKDCLPRSFSAAMEGAKADVDIPVWVGEELLEKYFKMKDKEVELFGKMTDEERRQKFIAFF